MSVMIASVRCDPVTSRFSPVSDRTGWRAQHGVRACSDGRHRGRVPAFRGIAFLDPINSHAGL